MNPNNSNQEFTRNTSNNFTQEKKYTMQSLMNKIKSSDTCTIGNSYVDLSEIFPNSNNSEENQK